MDASPSDASLWTEVSAAEMLGEKLNDIAIAGSDRDGRAYRLFPAGAIETKRNTLPILHVSAGARTRNYGPLIAVGFFAVVAQLCVMRRSFCGVERRNVREIAHARAAVMFIAVFWGERV